MAATTTTKSRMAMRTPQPSANLFITIIDNCKRSLFQDRSDLRSDHLPLTALFRKCVGPDEFSVEEILRSLMRPNCSLTHDDSSVAIQAYSKIIDFEFGEYDVAGHGLQILLFVHDAAVRPDNRAIFGLKPLRV